MASKKKEAVIYAYDNELLQIRPLIEGGTVTKEEAFAAFMNHPVMAEGLKTEEDRKPVSEVMAEAKKGDEGMSSSTSSRDEKGESRTYSLTYFNPETEKAEVVETKVDIKITDYTTRMIEESVGIGSVYPLYAFIASPMIRTEVKPWLLKEILDEREYATPPPTGSAPAVKVADQGKQSEIVAVVKQNAAAREAVVESVVRKERSEDRLDQEIAVFEEVVAALRRGEDTEAALSKLPPLSRARFLAAAKMRTMDRKKIIGLLVRDVRLLKGMRKKLETMTADGLLGLVRAMKKIKK